MEKVVSLILKLIKAFYKPALVVVPPPKDNGDLPHPAPVPEPAWLEIARKEIGVKEYFYKQNKRILEYHMATSLNAKDQSVPWCASFVCWCLATAGVKSTSSARAKDYLHWGYPMNLPRVGCIAVFDRDGGGHVGFYVGETNTSVIVLGGNQQNGVNISNYKKENLLGYRWPKQ